MLIADQFTIKETITTNGITNVRRIQFNQWLDSFFRIEDSINDDSYSKKQKGSGFGCNPGRENLIQRKYFKPVKNIKLLLRRQQKNLLPLRKRKLSKDTQKAVAHPNNAMRIRRFFWLPLRRKFSRG
jgi:hypothetical protein